MSHKHGLRQSGGTTREGDRQRRVFAQLELGRNGGRLAEKLVECDCPFGGTAERHDGADLRPQTQHVARQFHQQRIDEQRGYADVARERGHLLRRHAVGEMGQHRAGARRAEMHHRIMRRVGAQNGDVASLAEPSREQRVGDAVGQPIRLRKSHPLVAPDKSLLVRQARSG